MKMSQFVIRGKRYIFVVSVLGIWLCLGSSKHLTSESQVTNTEYCSECHKKRADDSVIQEDLSVSVHEGLECSDCHKDKDFYPHEKVAGFSVWSKGCSDCHETQFTAYKMHGSSSVDENWEIPSCAVCHGSHEIQSPSTIQSYVHPVNLPDTCGLCHEDPKLMSKYENLSLLPVKTYRDDIHSKTSGDRTSVTASCKDCHASEGDQHKILSAQIDESSIHPDNLQKTCDKCHPKMSKSEASIRIHLVKKD